MFKLIAIVVFLAVLLAGVLYVYVSTQQGGTNVPTPGTEPATPFPQMDRVATSSKASVGGPMDDVRASVTASTTKIATSSTRVPTQALDPRQIENLISTAKEASHEGVEGTEYVVKETSSYKITYFSGEGSVVVALKDVQEGTRGAVESYLANTLGVSEAELCAFDITVAQLPVGFITYQSDVGLSACPQ